MIYAIIPISSALSLERRTIDCLKSLPFRPFICLPDNEFSKRCEVPYLKSLIDADFAFLSSTPGREESLSEVMKVAKEGDYITFLDADDVITASNIPPLTHDVYLMKMFRADQFAAYRKTYLYQGGGFTFDPDKDQTVSNMVWGRLLSYDYCLTLLSENHPLHPYGGEYDLINRMEDDLIRGEVTWSDIDMNYFWCYSNHPTLSRTSLSKFSSEILYDTYIDYGVERAGQLLRSFWKTFVKVYSPEYCLFLHESYSSPYYSKICEQACKAKYPVNHPDWTVIEFLRDPSSLSTNIGKMDKVKEYIL